MKKHVNPLSVQSAICILTAVLAANCPAQGVVQPTPLAMPKLASAQIRIDPSSFSDDSPFAKITALRATRDEALKKLGAVDGANVAANDIGLLASAAAAVVQVCGIGTDYIQYRLSKNAKSQFWAGLASGVFAIGGAGSAVIESAKAMGLTSVALSNYKTSIVENGDAGHNNAELKKILEDVRLEIASGMHHYNAALLLPTTNAGEKLTQYRNLHSAVLEMHNACAFF